MPRLSTGRNPHSAVFIFRFSTSVSSDSKDVMIEAFWKSFFVVYFFILLEWVFPTISPCDAAEPWQLGFQDAATPMMQGIIDLHHDIFYFLIMILVFVLRIVVSVLWNFHYKKNPIPQRIVHGTTIEILWTIYPSIILMFIAIPSFALLYLMDEVVVDPAITIKVIGHQWYWTYEYSDYNSSDEQSLTFDSYMIPEDDLELGQLRFLEVDNRVVVPAKTHLRFIVTSADVLHSWAVPSLGVKCDAVPGRLNQISILVQREGVYYGQCSEICGTNHALMPIVIETVPRKDFDYWCYTWDCYDLNCYDSTFNTWTRWFGVLSECQPLRLDIKEEILRKMNDLATSSVNNYLDLYEGEALREFPDLTRVYKSDTFRHAITHSFLSDSGLSSDPMTLTQLKAINKNVMKALERVSTYRNNDLYDNVVDYVRMLRGG